MVNLVGQLFPIVPLAVVRKWRSKLSLLLCLGGEGPALSWLHGQASYWVFTTQSHYSEKPLVYLFICRNLFPLILEAENSTTEEIAGLGV